MFGKNVEVGYEYVVGDRVGNDWSHDGLINLDHKTRTVYEIRLCAADGQEIKTPLSTRVSCKKILK